MAPNDVHVAESTPTTLQYRNPRIKDVLESQSAKRKERRGPHCDIHLQHHTHAGHHLELHIAMTISLSMLSVK